MTMNSKQGRIDASSWDGSLSRSEFYRAASAFAERWNKFNSAFPQCTWVPSQSLPWLSASTSLAEGYLSVNNIILPCSTEQSNQFNDEEVKEELSCSDFTDDAMLRITIRKDATMTSTLFTALLIEFQYCTSVHATVMGNHWL